MSLKKPNTPTPTYLRENGKPGGNIARERHRILGSTVDPARTHGVASTNFGLGINVIA